MDDSNIPATKGDLQRLQDELLEAFRDGQTEILKAFYNFVESKFERRVTELEKRLNIPPAA